MKTVLVTGGAGFIGSHFVDLVIDETDFQIILMDKLTYAGKLENMSSFINSNRVQFIKGDICDFDLVMEIFEKNQINYVVNFAAESHVDNSISGPLPFIETNIKGTFNLLESARLSCCNTQNKFDFRFIQISTDEVYGSTVGEESFFEETALNPRNPYSATKAASDHLVMSYFTTYNMPVIITRSSNNYGPRQDKEKLIPKSIARLLSDEMVTIYGDGKNVRDWLYVKDNCKAILGLLKMGIVGQIYNICGNNEMSNLSVLNVIIQIMDKNGIGLLDFVKDRPGHDFRYSINDSKSKKILGKYSITNFEDGIRETIDYYRVFK